MALSAKSMRPLEPPLLVDAPPYWSNDAFSFWKVPEEWRTPLESTIAPSAAAADRMLLEEYLPEPDRRPPYSMRAYYRIKRLIPSAVRHRLNAAAVRVRSRLEFPHW